VTATNWPAREQGLRRAYQAVAARHNELGITEFLDPNTRPYFDRPFQVPDARRFSAALQAAITDQQIRQLPMFGGVDGFIDNTDALGRTEFLQATIAAAMSEPDE